MILTNEDLQNIQDIIEQNSGLDKELLNRSAQLLRSGATDDAVRSAFILLEERLRKAVNKEKENISGTNLANYAFGPTGVLTKHLAYTASEQEGLLKLFSGAFQLFRNPTAHGVIGYEVSEGRELIMFVNLLLRILKRIEDLPPPNSLPKDLELMLANIEKQTSFALSSQIRLFIGKCLKIGLRPGTKGTTYFPFKKLALMQASNKIKPHKITVFYIRPKENGPYLEFYVGQHYPEVIGFNVEKLVTAIKELGFNLDGKAYVINLIQTNDSRFFEKLILILSNVAKDLDNTLTDYKKI